MSGSLNADPLGTGFRTVLMHQVLIAAVVVVGFALLQDLLAAVSSAFGAVAAIVMSALLAFKIKCLDRRLKQNKAVSVGTVMLGFAPRLLLILIIFLVGIQVFRLSPLPMVVAFALVHFGYLFNSIKLKR